MDSFAYASNPTDNLKAKNPNENPLEVAPWFITNEYDGPKGARIAPERRDTKPPEIIKVGETSQYFYPGAFDDEGREFNRWIGTLKEGDGRKLYFGAHTHLQVSTTIGNLERDDWEVDTKQQTNTTAVTFTWKDGP